MQTRDATRGSGEHEEREDDVSERYDFVIIGAGPAGEAAASVARELGASVAIADRRWSGGSCPHVGCLPSKVPGVRLRGRAA